MGRPHSFQIYHLIVAINIAIGGFIMTLYIEVPLEWLDFLNGQIYALIVT